MGATAALKRAGYGHSAAAADSAWLEAVGYPGLKLLAEALADPISDVTLEKDAMGLDLKNVSCVFLSRGVDEMIAALDAGFATLN